MSTMLSTAGSSKPILPKSLFVVNDIDQRVNINVRIIQIFMHTYPIMRKTRGPMVL